VETPTKPATAEEIREFTFDVSDEQLEDYAAASRRRVGPIGSSTNHKVSSSRRSEHWPITGRRTTTGALSRSATRPCRTSSPRSTA
jgi:hypothetical protein